MDAVFALAKNIARIEYGDIPPNVVSITKKDVLDILGTMLAGSGAPGSKEVVDLVAEWGGKAESTIAVYGPKVPSPFAALANVTMAHARDYDDTHDLGMLHAGVAVVPATFAISERKGSVSGKQFITAVTLGIDITCRMGLASKLTPVASGWMYSSLYAYFGATAAVGKIIRLDEARMVDALGITYSQAAGTRQPSIDGALTKRMQPAFGAKAAVLSALMSDKGITGAKNCLEGPAGLYNVYHRGDYDRNWLTTDLGTRFEGVNLSFKPYPCCRVHHCYIDAALQLVNEHDIKPEDVEEIKVFGHEQARAHCYPLDIKQRPRNLVDAQFSLPYTVAVAIARRKLLIEDFTEEAIKDPVTLALASKVTLQFDEKLATRGMPPGIIEIRTKDEKTLLSKRVDFAKGHPLNPMSWNEIVGKFRDCSSYSARPLAEGTVEKAIEMVENLEHIDDVSKIIQLLA